ncbi:MAG: hypothetical protein Q8M01_22945 [Rubrivivax sp.]|nr:hypothetical protein [Rubrivivax sp.]
MLTIRREQQFAVQRDNERQFERDMLVDLRAFYPADHELLGDAGLHAVVHAGVVEGLTQGLSTRGDLRKFIHLRMVLGSGLLRDPLLPWAAEIARAGLGTPGAIDRLLAEATDFVAGAHGSNGLAALRAMHRAAELPWSALAHDDQDADPDAVTLSLLSRLWPQKFRLLPVDRRAPWLQATARTARRAGLTSRGALRCHATMAFLLGAEFVADPALPWAAASLAGTAGSTPDTRAQALQGAGQSALAALRPLLAATTDT